MINYVQINDVVANTKVASSAKTCQNASNDFNTVLKKSSDNSGDKTSKIKSSSSKPVDGTSENVNKASQNSSKDTTDVSKDSNNDKVQSNNNKIELDEKLKDDLKQMGLSEKDIENLEEDLAQGNINENSLMYLINMLIKMENNSTNNLNAQGNGDEFITQISNKISSEILQNLKNIVSDNQTQNVDTKTNEIISKIIQENVSDLSDILNQFRTSQEFNDKIIEKLNNNIVTQLAQKGNVSDNVKSQVSNILSKELTSNTIQQQPTNSLSELKLQNQYISSNDESTNKTVLFSPLKVYSDDNSNLSDSSHKDAQSSTGNSTSKNEESILKKIIEGGTEDKISKVTNFMANLKNIDTSNTTQNLEQIVINKNSFDADIIKTLKYMDINNVKELTVKINPKELGEITINLTMQEGKLKAVLTASNKEAYNLLNANLQDLSNKIQTNDIKIQGLSLNIYNEDSTFFRDESKKEQYKDNNGQNENSNRGNVIGEDKVQNSYYDNNNVNILA